MADLPKATPKVNLEVVPTMRQSDEKQDVIGGVAVNPTLYHTRPYCSGGTPMEDNGPPINPGVSSPLISDRLHRALVGEAHVEGVLAYKPWTMNQESYLAGGSDYFTITVKRTIRQPAVADPKISELWQQLLTPGSVVVLRSRDGQESDIGEKLSAFLTPKKDVATDADDKAEANKSYISGKNDTGRQLSGNKATEDVSSKSVILQVALREESLEGSETDAVRPLDLPSHIHVFVVKDAFKP